MPESVHAPDDADETGSTLPDAPALGPDDGAATDPESAPEAAPAAGPVLDDDLAAANGNRTRAHPLPATAGLGEPLLSDADGLRTRWQRAQAGFVDDPQEAVGEAADLIEQTAQAMVGALRQRQRQLRVMWESGPASGPAFGDGKGGDGESAARGGRDTEHLRQMMRHYRALFDQLCRP